MLLYITHRGSRTIHTQPVKHTPNHATPRCISRHMLQMCCRSTLARSSYLYVPTSMYTQSPFRGSQAVVILPRNRRPDVGSVWLAGPDALGGYIGMWRRLRGRRYSCRFYQRLPSVSSDLADFITGKPAEWIGVMRWRQKAVFTREQTLKS